MAVLTETLRNQILEFQRNEITEYHLYRRLAAATSQPQNRQVLEKIAEDERRHYEEWKGYTGQDVTPNWWKIRFYYLISRVFGLTFGLKLMERGEEQVQEAYRQVAAVIPDVAPLVEEETQHEDALLGMLDEEQLNYIGSIVLGLNDALVELTGALAGLTLALQNAPLIALSGLITGVAAAMSMAASEYLSTKAEDTDRNPARAAIYTGIAYIVTVFLLVLPYLVFPHLLWGALALTLLIAVLIIALFNYYYAVVTDTAFRPRFVEMAVLSLGVAVLSFGVGLVARRVLGVEVD